MMTVELEPALWLDRHGDYLYRYAIAQVRRPDVAEDLVQETLLAAWKGRADFAGQSSERTWLTGILKRRAIDWLRRDLRDRVASTDTDRFADGMFTRRGEWKTPPGQWDPITPTERTEFWTVLNDCLGKLPPRLHNAFALRYLDDQVNDAVCREMGLTTANLWVMLHRARLRMWWCLSQNWFDDPTPSARSEP